MIDCDKIKEHLNKKMDIALEIAKCRQEVWKNRNLENDKSYDWEEVNFVQKVILYECDAIYDELEKWKKPYQVFGLIGLFYMTF
jgi:hypothetical protein